MTVATLLHVCTLQFDPVVSDVSVAVVAYVSSVLTTTLDVSEAGCVDGVCGCNAGVEFTTSSFADG